MSRGATPIFVGGTPLYFKALLQRLFQGPAADWEFSERLTAEPRPMILAGCTNRYAGSMPRPPTGCTHGTPKRLIRVLEVFEKTGQPITALQQQFDRTDPRANVECSCSIGRAMSLSADQRPGRSDVRRGTRRRSRRLIEGSSAREGTPVDAFSRTAGQRSVTAK